MVGLFLWDRIRYDLVALLALLSAVLCGIVPGDKAFTGFANPVVPLIGSALIVSAAIGQSGAIEIVVRWLKPLMHSRDMQVGLLVACVTALSAFMKNVGALAIFIPAAVQVARRNQRSPSEFLMPLGFASLLGGSMTLVGTSPNILISSVRQELTGHPFEMFDFTPVSGGVAVLGVVFLAFGWRLLPRGLRGSASEAAFTIEDYTSELRLGAGSAYIGRTVGEIEDLTGGAIAVTAIIREKYRRYVPAGSWTLYPEDVLVVEADPQTLEQFARDGNLELVGGEELPASATAELAEAGAGPPGDRPEPPDNPPPAPRPAEASMPLRPDRLSVVEAVVTAGSDLVGHSAAELHLRERHGVNVLAIGRRGRRTSVRLRRVRFQLGDAIVFQGYAETIHDALAALGCLPLAERQLNLGRPRQLVLPLLILAAAIGATAFEIVPVQIAFVGAALAIVLCGLLTLKEAYGAVEWPILILIGSMIPIGEAVMHTGTTTLIAHSIAGFAAHLPVYGVLAVILGFTMLVTPVLHHAAAVLVMGPIAATLAQQLGYAIDPFLIAVALGAGSDFLTPIGHQSNTLVMGPGGYRFGDYWKLGLPLSVLVVALGVPLIMTFWRLH
ncbi:MAG: SLC13 family permease [Alphaproteobacteria bacterium]|nr:SLC13 family permease [Alphaproteobacteria bacterium]